jgi:hypothetical protein
MLKGIFSITNSFNGILLSPFGAMMLSTAHSFFQQSSPYVTLFALEIE